MGLTSEGVYNRKRQGASKQDLVMLIKILSYLLVSIKRFNVLKNVIINRRTNRIYFDTFGGVGGGGGLGTFVSGRLIIVCVPFLVTSR